MLTEVYPNIYLNEIPLPKNPLKSINSYIVVSDQKNIIIDTGFDNKACRDALLKAIDELGVDFKRTDLLLTHMHPDHSGLASFLKEKGVRVYIGGSEAKAIKYLAENQNKLFEQLNSYLSLEKGAFPVKREWVKKLAEIAVIPLSEGEMLSVGDYSFEVIDIPGHTPGHIGLYERKYKISFCGDHILDDISPNITFWNFERDILNEYFNSLKKIYKYEIEYLFAGHRNIIKNHRKRIEEILAHHEERLKEIKKIIDSGKKTPSQTAAAMKWNLKDHMDWNNIPFYQKWFASGEAMSHLEHLVRTGTARKFIEDSTLYYESR